MPFSSTPLIVVGSGIAGLLSARLAADTRPVTLLTKNSLLDSNTHYSQGGIAAVWAENDSIALHSQDTVNAGGGWCDPQAVEVLSSTSKDAIEHLIELGVRFDTDSEDHYALAMEGAHSVHRVMHAGGDSTGLEIQRALIHSVQEHPHVTLQEFSCVTELLLENGAIKGVEWYNKSDQSFHQMEAPQVILATGGAGQLFDHTSNSECATGDGVVMAYRAGAAVKDLEFFQFHPTALNLEGAPHFLISEAVRGEGAILRDIHGNAIMHDLHPKKDLAPRDFVSRTIEQTVLSDPQQSVFLDATSLEGDYLRKRFPTITQTCLNYGIDIRKDWIPVHPVAHYMIGGIQSDLWGRCTIPGLYANGEVACTGVHGANRLASNSLLEGVVFSIRSIQNLNEDLQSLPKWDSQSPIADSNSRKSIQFNNSLNRDQLRSVMWKYMGIIRNESSISSMIQELSPSKSLHFAKQDMTHWELNSMKYLGWLMSQAALARRKSLGAHFREDS